MASKNAPDIILSGAGWLTQFAAGAIPELRARGVTDEDIHRLGTQAGADDMERGIEAYCNAIAGPNLDEFFQIREGLWVSNEFREWILAPALALPTTSPSTVGKPFDLPDPMDDDTVQENLGDKHLFENPRGFCLTLARMIVAQPNGEGGTLLNNGYANIFYVRGLNGEVFAAVVYWNSNGRRWNVSASRLDDYRWSAGYRAFPATAVAWAASP